MLENNVCSLIADPTILNGNISSDCTAQMDLMLLIHIHSLAADIQTWKEF